MAAHAAATDQLRVYFSRVKPVYRELFNMAHAICGNYELAEYAVQRALLTCFFKDGLLKSRVGFRENLRAAVRRASYEQTLLMEDVEIAWDGFREDAIDGAKGDPVLEMATLEDVDTRRILMLRHGCGLRPGQIAKIARRTPQQVREILDRFERRLKRRLPARERARADASIVRSARGWLAEQASGVPEAGAVYRGFEAEVMETGGPKRAASRALATVVAGILALFCAAIFWATMVLLHPPQMEVPSEPAAVSAPAPEARIDLP